MVHACGSSATTRLRVTASKGGRASAPQSSVPSLRVASQLAFGGGRMNAAYIASKGAIVSLVKTAAFELAPDNIRVNAVAPGATDTPMMRRSQSRAADPDAAREYARKRHALGRFGKPEEIANGITHLLSDEASFTTGSVLTIDGGWRAA